MTVRITTLSENTAAFGYVGEWGLSLLVDVNGRKVLLDTGMSFSAVRNAELLKIDLHEVEAIVLSHGHIDHTGGLRKILERAGPKRIFAHPDIWKAKYSTKRGSTYFSIGIPFSQHELKELGASFTLSKDPAEVTPGVLTSGEVPMLTDYEEVEKSLYYMKNDEIEPDPLLDDLSLAVKTEKGLIVILGCAHRGPINIIHHFQKVTGEKRIYAVVGGTHLWSASQQRIEKTIIELLSLCVEKVACSHCTGPKATAKMADAFGDNFIYNNAGMVLDFT
jgi:7,8-dihydropterin-6-yl-methyl-4-(beta-D-ribofuranosyl)aminobenzene 5'-phosphate synthase